MAARARYIVVRLIAQIEDEAWASECPELGVYSCGDTANEALEAVREAALLKLETLAELGELDEFLRRRNIKTCEPKRTKVVEASSIEFSARRVAKEDLLPA